MHNFNLLYYMLNIVASESAFKRTMADKKRLLFSILAFIVSFHLCFCQPGLPADFSICFLFCFSSFIRALYCFSFIYVYPLLWFYPTTGGTFSQCLFSLGLFSYSAKVLLSFLPAQRNLFYNTKSESEEKPHILLDRCRVISRLALAKAALLALFIIKKENSVSNAKQIRY